MNNNSKKSIFNKKNIIIFTCVFIVILGVCFLIFGLENEKVMKCTMSIDDYAYANIDMDINVYHKNEVSKLEGKIYFDVTNEILKNRIDELEKNLKSFYGSNMNNDSVNINVSREDFKIIIDYSIDTQNIESKDFENLNLFPVDVEDKYTAEEFKDQIEQSGGSCIEE